MSFIRCTSNPEGLYVYHNVDGTIIWVGKGMEKETKIPANIFYTFVKLMPHYYSDFKRGSLEIREINYPLKKKLTKLDKEFKKIISKDWVPSNDKITLFYKGQEVARMWPVTWKYIYDGIIRATKFDEAKKNNKKRKAIK